MLFLFEAFSAGGLSKNRKARPDGELFEAPALAREGRREEALRLLRPFEERYQEGTFGLSAFTQVYASVGDEANSLKWLEMSADR